MSDARPKLEVVPGGAGSAPQAGEPEPAGEPPQRRNWILWVALGGLVAALIGLALENRRADGLAAEIDSLTGVVVELEAELSSAEASLAGHREHLGRVRSAIEELSLLAERDPEAAAPAATTAPAAPAE